ncbi:MAG: hypothetical protein J6U93_04155 [Alistipes sp.]|nr:hypothetical protein [Alistipes sp.]
MTKYIYTLLLLFVSTFAYAQVDTTLYSSVEEDPRYLSLCSEYDSLSQSEESAVESLAEARTDYIDAKSEGKSCAEVEKCATNILNIERELFDIRARRKGVAGRISQIEQRYILNEIYRGVKDESVGRDNAKDDRAESIQLIDNAIIERSLSTAGYADLKLAHEEDMAMPRLVEEYVATYKRLGRCVRAYDLATEESEGEVIYDDYLELRDMADSLGGVIERYWNHILNTKYYAYGYILECYGLFDLLDNSSADFVNMQQVCANEDGRYQLDALAHYALGRPTLVSFERDFANEMGLRLSADSLQRVYDSITMPDYRLEQVVLDRKSFVEYEPLTFGAKDFYNDANPIPEVVVYQRGTIYRILLGVFRNKQSNAIFKGAQPLYLTKGDEGHSYYVAGFATEEEAMEAVEMLMDKGFKEPQICCWRDGKMRNLSEPEPENEEVATTQSSGQRYIVLLESNTLSESLRNIIEMVAPDKRVWRRGAGFAVGTFSERSEAENLHKALLESDPNTSMSIVELNIQ